MGVNHLSESLGILLGAVGAFDLFCDIVISVFYLMRVHRYKEFANYEQFV